MKNLKYLFLTLFGALAFVACTEDEREADWSGIKGKGVYFAVDAPTTYLVEENQSSLRIPVQRTFTDGDLQVLVSLTDEAETGLFAADTKARFADGEAEGYVEIVFDFKKLEPGTGYELEINILDNDHKSDYGMQNLIFVVKYDPWKTVGTALWRDDIFDLIGYAPGLETEVELQQSLLDPNMYRLVDVYDADFLAQILGMSPAAIAGFVNPHYINFNIADPEKVYIPISSLGVNLPDYGQFAIGSLVPEFFQVDTGVYGVLKNNVINFPAESIVVNLSGMGEGWYYTNMSGLCRIVLPGGSPIDPRVDVTYKGHLTDPDSNTEAIFDVKMNSDAASFRWTITNTLTTPEEIDAFVAGIVDGSVDYETGAAAGEYSHPMDEAGSYYAVFVPYSADGLIVGTATVLPFEYVAGGVTPSEFAVEFAAEAGDTTLDLTITPNAKNFAYYWDMVPKANYEQIIAQFGSLEGYTIAYLTGVAEQNGVSLSDVLAVYASKGTIEGMYFEQLPSATEFIAYAYCVNMTTGEARSEISTAELATTTPAELDADYEAWLGTWEVQPTAMENGAEAAPFQITFSLKQSNNMFYMKGWGLGTVLPQVPVTTVYQVNDDGSTLIYVPEQLTNSRQYVNGQYADVAFLARFWYEQAAAYYCCGVGAISLVAALENQNAAYMEPYFFEDEQLGEVALSGADYFLMFADGGLSAEVSDFAVGPYTLTKVANPETMSLEVSKFVNVRKDQLGKSKEMRAREARALHNAKYNCVMVR